MRLHERWRRLPQTTIAKGAGLARGGGPEMISSLDLRFAALETAAFGQFETLTGIVPGAGATAHLPRLVGRARALEIVLTGGLIDAATAERWGWVNRALPAAELDAYVDWVALTIANLPAGVRVAATKAIDAADGPLEDALRAEDRYLGETFTPASGELAKAALAAGAHTREVELNLEEVLRANLARRS
jgi:enoyl-CoA hydratase/carnithine racemase